MAQKVTIPDDLRTVRTGDVPISFVPKTDREFAWACSDPMWRLCSGQLYKIKTKPPESEDGEEAPERVVVFKPNRAQRKLIRKMHKWNIILKARQLGFTTFIAIYYLDCAIFAKKESPVTAAIIAHTEDDAKEIFDDKVKFAYDNLPPRLYEVLKLKKNRADALEFAHNNSKIRVTQSGRSGTLTHLHISEYGKICATNPQRAKEIQRGALAAAAEGLIFIESTAEGNAGVFFEMVQHARRIALLNRRLTDKEFKFHFYPWWDDKNYRMDADDVIISPKEHEYFDSIEAEMKTFIDIEQRAWWISIRDNFYAGEDESMWQEYPSTPDEAFQQSAKGCYYTNQMTKMRKENRICRIPFEPGVPVDTFWDIGNRDGTAIWLHQKVGPWHRFIGFIEGWGEAYAHYVAEMQKFQQRTGCIWGTHYLPHDGAHEKQGETTNASPRTMLENVGLRRIDIVPRVSEIQHGIQATRNFMATVMIDEVECKEGIVHLDSYKKSWNERQQCFNATPLHDVHSEAADAFRQAAQVYVNNDHVVKSGTRPKRPRRGGMAA